MEIIPSFASAGVPGHESLDLIYCVYLNRILNKATGTCNKQGKHARVEQQEQRNTEKITGCL